MLCRIIDTLTTYLHYFNISNIIFCMNFVVINIIHNPGTKIYISTPKIKLVNILVFIVSE